MFLFAAAVLMIAVTVAITLSIRSSDMPTPEAISPVRHLEDRRAAIYENLRDLQFEYRVGKLSEADYQTTKNGLQRELAGVLAEIEKASGKTPQAAPKTTPKVTPKTTAKATATPAAESDPATEAAPPDTEPAPAQKPAAEESAMVCPHCGAEFGTPMRFCGECGKAMQ